MARMHPVVAGVGGDVDARIVHARPQVLIGRIAGDIGRFLGDARVAVFADPRRPGGQFVIAQHVDQRAFDHRRIEQFGMLGHRHAGQHPAVRPAVDAQMFRAGDPAPDQVPGDGGEVVEGQLPVLLQHGAVPGRAELGPAAHVGVDEDAPALQPQLAHLRDIGGRLGHLEAAVAEQDGRRLAVHRQGFRPHHEIGDHRPIGRGGLELLHHMGRGVEPRRSLAQHAGRAVVHVRQAQGRRRQKALDRIEEPARPLGRVAQADADVLGRGDVGPGPAELAPVLEHRQTADDIVGNRHDHPVVHHPDAADRLAVGRLEDDVRLIGQRRRAGRGPQAGDADRQQRSGLVVAALSGPILVRGDDQRPALNAVDVYALGQLQLHRPAIDQFPGLLAIGVQRAGDDHGRRSSLGVAIDRGADAIAAVRGVAAIDLGRLGQGLAALQRLDDIGIAALGQGAVAVLLAEVGGDQQGVAVQPFDPMLALRQGEAVVDEAFRRGVELAHEQGVLAAVRQEDQTAGLVRRQTVGPLPHPVPALGAGQGVDVQQRLPPRVGRGVTVQRRAPPYALGIGRVLPEIADALAQETGSRNAVGGGQDRFGLAAIGLIARIAGQRGQRALVLAPHEGHGLVPVDLFQGQVIVGGAHPGGRQVGRQIRRRRGLGHGGLQRRGGRGVQCGAGAQHQGRQGGGQQQATHRRDTPF